jgi:hypothetical protein
LNQARPDRVDEVGAVHAVEGFPHRIEIQQIADNNLRPPLAESFGPVVLAMHESANTFPSIEELRCRGAAGRAGGSRNKEAGI